MCKQGEVYLAWLQALRGNVKEHGARERESTPHLLAWIASEEARVAASCSRRHTAAAAAPPMSATRAHNNAVPQHAAVLLHQNTTPPRVLRHEMEQCFGKTAEQQWQMKEDRLRAHVDASRALSGTCLPEERGRPVSFRIRPPPNASECAKSTRRMQRG
jgi:hypothetical protein